MGGGAPVIGGGAPVIGRGAPVIGGGAPMGFWENWGGGLGGLGTILRAFIHAMNYTRYII